MERILSEGLARGWWAKGDTILDPFGGVGLGGVLAASAGFRWLGCELEKKFYDLALENFALHKRTWEAMGDPLPRMINGDSRKLSSLLAPLLAEGCVSSPPFAETQSGGGIAIHGNYRVQGETGPGGYQATHQGSSPGQLGSMSPGNLDAVVSSPPFSGTEQPCASQTQALKDYHAFTRGRGTKRDATLTSGDPAQLGAMPTGEVSAVRRSPPYSSGTVAPFNGNKPPEVLKAWFESYRSQGGGMGYERFVEHVGNGRRCGMDNYAQEEGQLANLPSGSVEGVISSPPYAESVIGSADYIARMERLCQESFDSLAPRWQREVTKYKREQQATSHSHLSDQGYGSTSGQLGAMPPGCVDGLLSSPPYADSVHDTGETKEANLARMIAAGCDKEQLGRVSAGPGGNFQASDYGATPGQAGRLPAGELDALLSSPPYSGESGKADRTGHERAVRAAETTGMRQGLGCFKTSEAYGDSEGQLGKLSGGSVESVLSSPPYGAHNEPGRVGNAEREAALLPADRIGQSGHGDGYGDTPGQLGALPMLTTIGNTSSETFWSAARDIVLQCRLLLKPGAFTCWIVKDFIRSGQRVDFAGDWCKLLEVCGFQVKYRIRCWLVKETRTADLFEGETVKKKARKSFFRRLFEKRRPDLAIDWEEVVVAVRLPE